jgi:N-acyl-L-homoserine lactone synthetase
VLDAAMDGFQEHGYRITWKLTLSELRKVSELRAEVFCRELGWTGSPEDRVERDEFDDGSTQIAVLDEESEVIGAVRMTGSGAPWMLDTVFSALAPEREISKDCDTAEASRLAVHRRWRGRRLQNGMRACDLLYKAAYVYCRTNGIRYLYMVTSDIVLEHMQRSGLPCQAIGAPRQMPDGVRAVTVVLDWNRIRAIPALADWYESGWQMPPASPPGVTVAARSRRRALGPWSRPVRESVGPGRARMSRCLPLEPARSGCGTARAGDARSKFDRTMASGSPITGDPIMEMNRRKSLRPGEYRRTSVNIACSTDDLTARVRSRVLS